MRFGSKREPGHLAFILGLLGDHCQYEVRRLRRSTAAGVAACRSRVRAKELDPVTLQCIGSLGKLIGPPWTQDQKYATVVALMALAC